MEADGLKPPDWVDSSRLDWKECRCGGFIARDGVQLYHDVPACASFRDAVLAAGGKISEVKDVGRN